MLLIGLALIIIELIFIPGTTVVGLLGLAFAIVGIVISYGHFGSDIGFYILIGSLVTTLGAMFIAFRTGAWNRFAHKSSIDSRVNEGIMSGVQIGDEGITLSTLKPMGKAEFNNQTFEVKTAGNYIDRGERVKIIFIESHQIVVEPIN
ncbi:MAG TPA: NfeD family protein [Chryseolinea sp.]|nr:NfeD family protein [Chryseolinea sp.]